MTVDFINGGKILIINNNDNTFKFDYSCDKSGKQDLKLIPPRATKFTDSRFLAIEDYILNNINGDLSLTALCGKFYLNKRYFEKIFKRYTGMTVYNYITYIKLAYSVIYFIKNKSVQYAAFTTGFSTTQNFSKFFKKQMGISPKIFKGLFQAISEDKDINLYRNIKED